MSNDESTTNPMDVSAVRISSNELASAEQQNDILRTIWNKASKEARKVTAGIRGKRDEDEEISLSKKDQSRHNLHLRLEEMRIEKETMTQALNSAIEKATKAEEKELWWIAREEHLLHDLEQMSAELGKVKKAVVYQKVQETVLQFQDLKQNLIEMQTKLSKAELKVSDLQDAKDKADVRVDSLLKQLDDALSQTNQIGPLQTTLDMLQQENSEILYAFDEKNRLMSETLDDAERKISELQILLEAGEQRILENSKHEFAIEIATLKERITSMEAERNAARATITTLRRDLNKAIKRGESEISKQLKTLQRENDELRDEIARKNTGLQHALEALEAPDGSSNKLIVQLEMEAYRSGVSLSPLATTRSSLSVEQRHRTLVEQNRAYQSVAQKLQEALFDKEELIIRLQQANKILGDRVIQLEKQLVCEEKQTHLP